MPLSEDEKINDFPLVLYEDPGQKMLLPYVCPQYPHTMGLTNYDELVNICGCNVSKTRTHLPNVRTVEHFNPRIHPLETKLYKMLPLPAFSLTSRQFFRTNHFYRLVLELLYQPVEREGEGYDQVEMRRLQAFRRAKSRRTPRPFMLQYRYEYMHFTFLLFYRYRYQILN